MPPIGPWETYLFDLFAGDCADNFSPKVVNTISRAVCLVGLKIRG
jgi:hypothetical protein